MIQKFLDYITIERRYSSHTARAYERDLKELCLFLNVAPEDFDPLALTEADVKAWMLHMLESGNAPLSSANSPISNPKTLSTSPNSPLHPQPTANNNTPKPNSKKSNAASDGNTPRSVRRRLSSLRSFYKFLLRIGYVNKDITRAIISPKMSKPLPVFFKDSEMKQEEKTLNWADDFPSVRDCLIIQMLYQTGMRRTELLTLTDARIDLQQQQICVFGKRKKERIVPFGESLLLLIQRYLDFRQQQFPFQSPPEQQPFLLSDRGLPLSQNALYNIVRTRMGEVSNLKKHSPHVLRHTFATTMLDNGADIHSIQTLMGHASLATTQIYAHTTFAQLKKAYADAHPRARKNKKD